LLVGSDNYRNARFDLIEDVLSRRKALQTCAAAAALHTFSVSLKSQESRLIRDLQLNDGWLFGPATDSSSLEPDFDDKGFSKVTLPHSVTKLSWQNWDPAAWERVWTYRRRFRIPPGFSDKRVFLHFEHVMAAATPVVNGQRLPQHIGGFLPFQYEITKLLRGGENMLAVAVDSRWLNVPPSGSPKGPPSIDYMLPGGITGSVYLRAVPQVFIADVFAKPADILTSRRRVEVICSLDAAAASGSMRLEATLLDGARAIASSAADVAIGHSGKFQKSLTLTGLENVALWEVALPKLYDVVVTLFANGRKAVHQHRTRIGFREARFELDGFFLNGRRLQLFGLNRHELYPYFGRAIPRRMLRKDADILRHELNCNAVRCSHYPQSEAFLDRCDELGLLVWEEIPGWQYIGDESWQDSAVRDVKNMVRRDRNHASIVIWGVRINESRNDPALYRRTKEAAKLLDDSRPTSGSMVTRSTADWLQDVFAFDDYHSAPDGSVGLVPPVPGVPFFFSEAVGQFSYGSRGFNNKYRRAGDAALQQKQALYHAQVHDRGLRDPHYAGVIAWCAFEYGSLLGAYAGVKYPGVADVFRIPKLGASFYKTQIDWKNRPLIEPNFYWDFGPSTPSGPGKQAAIFSNLERLELFIDGKPHSTLHPDRAGFPNLKYPPFFADLLIEGARTPELHIDGYVGAKKILSRSFSANPASDQLFFHADDPEIIGDGADATRLVVRVVDKYGAPRLFGGGQVAFAVEGPGVLIGDNPFDLAQSGGAGAVWIQARPGTAGRIRVHARHSKLGQKNEEVNVRTAAKS
jgi:beta-galactosidase